MMEKRIRSRSKPPPNENNEMFQQFRSKLKKTFSKNVMRSLSIPGLRISNKILKDEEINKGLSRHKSTVASTNNSSRSSISDIYINSKLTGHDSNSHYLVHSILKVKHLQCDVCTKDLVLATKIISCKYCRIKCHKKCCHNIDMICYIGGNCMINDILDSSKQILSKEIAKSPDLSKVKLRKKISNTDISLIVAESGPQPPDDIGYADNTGISFNLYQGGLGPLMCGNLSVTSKVTSSTVPLSSSISHNSYDFTTLDSDSIKEYDIEVNPIIQKEMSSLDLSLSDVPGIDKLSAKISINTCDKICKPSFIYDEFDKNMVRIDWRIDDLEDRSRLFNENNLGLSSEMKSYDHEVCLLGTVLVYINLLRPIQIELTPRPSSIFDISVSQKNEDLDLSDVKIETMWLPRGTSKRLYINQATSASELIQSLLRKCHIRANPNKFGLYVHTIEGERKVSVRKMSDTECPLATLLTWSAKGMDTFHDIMSIKRLVLQENETGDIEWSQFSKHELLNFLRILSREEQDKSQEIRMKYLILKKEMIRLLRLINRTKSVTKL